MTEFIGDERRHTRQSFGKRERHFGRREAVAGAGRGGVRMIGRITLRPEDIAAAPFRDREKAAQAEMVRRGCKFLVQLVVGRLLDVIRRE